MFSELETDLVPTKHNESMWQTVDYFFNQTEPGALYHFKSFTNLKIINVTTPRTVDF